MCFCLHTLSLMISCWVTVTLNSPPHWIHSQILNITQAWMKIIYYMNFLCKAHFLALRNIRQHFSTVFGGHLNNNITNKIYKNASQFGGWNWIRLWFHNKTLYLNIVFWIGLQFPSLSWGIFESRMITCLLLVFH